MSNLRVTNLRGRSSGKSPKMPDGAVVTGVATATTFDGNLTGNATGLSGTPNLNVGVITATSFSGDGSALSGVDGTLDNWLYG